jgi:hypothetical protein
MNIKSIKKYLNIFGEISMSKNHSKPDDNWQYVEDSNSPEHNEALCPLFYTEENSETPMLVDKQGNVYKVANNTFTKNGTAIARVEEEGFKKTVFDFNDPLVEYYNGNIYRAQHRNDTVVIERYNNGTWVTVEEIGFSSRATVYTERLYHGRYYCLDRYNNTIYIFARDVFKSIIITVASLNNPRLFIHGDYINLVTSTGVNLYENVLSYHYKYSNGTIGNVNITNTGTIVVPSASTDVTAQGTFNVTVNKTFQTLICYKHNNKYYSDDETFQNEVTFSEGYAPQLVEGNTYRYNLYRTEYVYHGGLIAINVTSAHSMTTEWTIDVNNSPYPIDETHFEFTTSSVYNAEDLDYDDTDYTLAFENNLGYITSSEFYNITPKATIDFTNKSSGGVAYIPTSSIGVTNVRNSKTVYISAVQTTATTTQSTDFFTSYIMLDDGYYYGIAGNLTYPATTTKTWRGYNFKNRFVSDVDNTVTVESVDQKMLGTEYNTFEGITYDIGYGHFRMTILRNTGSAAWTYFAEKGKTRTIVYDSLSDIATIDCGVTPLNDFINETRFANNFYCPSGTREPSNDTFAMLVNNGYVSGFSYNGTLLTPWNSVDTEVLYYADDDKVFYRDANSGKWVLIEKIVQPVTLTLVEDRYVVLNTTSYYNCYDTVLNEMNKYADDWNMRIFYGSTSGSTAYTSTVYDDWIFASGRNVNFTVIGKKSGISSTVWPAGIFKAASRAPKFITEETLPIDLYSSKTASAPAYWLTVTNPNTGTTRQTKTDNDLKYYNAVYPLYNTAYMMRGPSLFAKFVNSGNNQDYMIEDGVGYQVLYENVEPMLLTATTGDIYGIESIFVIQSMPYAVIDGKIYSLSYLNGVYQGMDCIINVKGMKYIGSIPTKAYFYSPNNRAIYVFTGDANLTKVKDASAIDDIYYITFNSATQTIYMATNNGLYMLSDQNSYRQDWGTIDNVTFQDDGSSSVVVKNEDSYKLYRLYYEDAEGRKTNKVILNTGLLGAGEGKVFTIDKYNINLFSDQRRNGKIEITSYVLQDNGQISETTEEKTVNSSDWDDEFFCKQIDYTPPKNRGVGIGLSIVSDFAITSINASATVGQETQSASSGWHI